MYQISLLHTVHMHSCDLLVIILFSLNAFKPYCEFCEWQFSFCIMVSCFLNVSSLLFFLLTCSSLAWKKLQEFNVCCDHCMCFCIFYALYCYSALRCFYVYKLWWIGKPSFPCNCLDKNSSLLCSVYAM